MLMSFLSKVEVIGWNQFTLRSVSFEVITLYAVLSYIYVKSYHIKYLYHYNIRIVFNFWGIISVKNISSKETLKEK